MQIERNEIRCFHAVVEAGGFSRAAERLNLSQSAVSQAIANLEHRLGAVLLRRGNPPQLTEAGIRLLRYAETVLNEERETLADIAQIKTGALSTLSLALSPATNARFGIALLREFSERNPLTRFKVTVAPSREIVHGVSDGRWEVGFGPLQHTMPDYFTVYPCFAETRRLMIARDHPSREALKRDPQAILRTLPLVTSYLDEAARRAGGDRLRNAFASVWEVSHMELRLALVAESKAVTYVSNLVTELPPNWSLSKACRSPASSGRWASITCVISPCRKPVPGFWRCVANAGISERGFTGIFATPADRSLPLVRAAYSIRLTNCR